MNIARITELPLESLAPLVEQSKRAGWRHLERLREDWASGRNRFCGHGEALFSGWDQDALVAIGGVNREPHANDPSVARLRRLYVHEGYRGRGYGALLVAQLVEHAKTYFREIRLGAGSADAAAFFELLGFASSRASGTFTHSLILNGDPVRSVEQAKT